jgi:hypothetical protein
MLCENSYFFSRSVEENSCTGQWKKKAAACGLLVPKHSFAATTRDKALHKPWMPTLRAASEREKLQIPRPRSGDRVGGCFALKSAVLDW